MSSKWRSMNVLARHALSWQQTISPIQKIFEKSDWDVIKVKCWNHCKLVLASILHNLITMISFICLMMLNLLYWHANSTSSWWIPLLDYRWCVVEKVLSHTSDLSDSTNWTWISSKASMDTADCPCKSTTQPCTISDSHDSLDSTYVAKLTLLNCKQNVLLETYCRCISLSIGRGIE